MIVNKRDIHQRYLRIFCWKAYGAFGAVVSGRGPRHRQGNNEQVSYETTAKTLNDIILLDLAISIELC